MANLPNSGGTFRTRESSGALRFSCCTTAASENRRSSAIPERAPSEASRKMPTRSAVSETGVREESQRRVAIRGFPPLDSQSSRK